MMTPGHALPHTPPDLKPRACPEGRASHPAPRQHRTPRTLYLPLLLLGFGLLSGCASFARNHITVVKSVFLEQGQSIDPHALTQTHDGGYVIAGQGSSGSWATRVTAAGKVVWRYVGNPPSDSTLTGAVTLADDSTVLCGFTDRPRQQHGPDITGLLVHLSPKGRLLSRQDLYPLNNPRYSLNYLYHCMPWGRGVLVMGDTSRFAKHGDPFHPLQSVKHYLWLLKLDAQGRIAWQKLIPNLGGTEAEVLANQDLGVTSVTVHWGPPSPAQTLVTLLGPDGSVKAQHHFLGALHLLRSAARPGDVALMSGIGRPIKYRALRPQLRQWAHLTGAGHIIPTKKAYQLPDHAFALFGYTTPWKYGGMLISSIAWVSPHLNHQQVFRFKPWSIWVADAVPTGQPGMFATVRQVGPPHNLLRPSDIRQYGVVLSWVHIQ